jgi:hypothetical protein
VSVIEMLFLIVFTNVIQLCTTYSEVIVELEMKFAAIYMALRIDGSADRQNKESNFVVV